MNLQSGNCSITFLSAFWKELAWVADAESSSSRMTTLRLLPEEYWQKGMIFMADCCAARTKKRSEEELRSLSNRLNRIEGQIRGIRGMLERNAYCPEILAQAAAARAALDSFSRELLSNHIHSCVAEDIRAGREDTMDELLSLLQKMMH